MKIADALIKVKRAGKIKTSEYKDEGDFPVIDQGAGHYAGYSDRADLVHYSPLPIVVFGDHTRRVKIAKEPFICGADGTQLLYPNNQFDPIFFYYAVKNVDLSDYAYARHYKFLKEQEIPVPEMSTQKKIANILSTYDDLIENNLEQIKLLEEMVEITYSEWFTYLRFPDHELTTINPVSNLPEGWERKKVGSLLAKITKSKKIQSSAFLLSGSIPIIDQSRDFIAGYTNDAEALLDMGKPLIVFGDHTRVLKFITFPFARGADGTQVILSNNLRMPQHLFYFSLIALDLSNYHYARHFKFLKESEIVLPTQDIAEKFELYSRDKFALIQQLRQQNSLLEEARDILLPRLMTGVIDVESYDPTQRLKEAA